MPLLKNPKSLSKDDMKIHRPVPNLNCLSKIIEKGLANRIRSHLERNDLSNHYQSAYKKFHSTETALLKVENDIFSIWTREGSLHLLCQICLLLSKFWTTAVSPISCELGMVSMVSPLTCVCLTLQIVNRR